MTQIRKRRPATPKQAATCRGPIDGLLADLLARVHAALDTPTDTGGAAGDWLCAWCLKTILTVSRSCAAALRYTISRHNVTRKNRISMQ